MDKRSVSDSLAVASNGEKPLRECVREAMGLYFEAIGDHDCDNLMRFVLSEIEPPLLEAVLQHTNGNQQKAAKVLGIAPGTLRKKLELYSMR